LVALPLGQGRHIVAKTGHVETPNRADALVHANFSASRCPGQVEGDHKIVFGEREFAQDAHTVDVALCPVAPTISAA
jgi:hypothetical protein